MKLKKDSKIEYTQIIQKLARNTPIGDNIRKYHCTNHLNNYPRGHLTPLLPSAISSTNGLNLFRPQNVLAVGAPPTPEVPQKQGFQAPQRLQASGLRAKKRGSPASGVPSGLVSAYGKDVLGSE